MVYSVRSVGSIVCDSAADNSRYCADYADQRPMFANGFYFSKNMQILYEGSCDPLIGDLTKFGGCESCNKFLMKDGQRACRQVKTA